jgi:hypothetical protein
MAALGEVLPDDPAEIEDRRLRVKSMRLRRLSAKAIAAVLNERVAVIEADLEWLRVQHSESFGPAPTVDPSQEIGWAVADFEEMESVAWLEFHALKAEAQARKMSPMYVARARQGWIRTAAMMRVLRLKLLAEHGFLMPGTSSQTPGNTVARADDIRAMLRQEGLLLEVAASSAVEKDVEADPDGEGGADEGVILDATYVPEQDASVREMLADWAGEADWGDREWE